MTAASILLILVAVVLLVAGLADGSSPLLVTSIAASMLAAVALVARARRVVADQATGGRTAGPRGRTRTGPTGAAYGPRLGEPGIPTQHIPPTVGTGGPGWRQPSESPVTDPAERYAANPYSPPGPRARSRDAAPAPTSPAAEGPFDADPPAQHVSPADVARLARLDDAVRVVDGRARFHLPGCPHLVGRDDEALTVAEAVGSGFTPCARCAPATVLLTDAQSG
ncbi:hypothetical protein [Micromonospora sp. SL4-19]|uniref:hypothetical protein n=1 Tax=Micromonospora sp. SL4-19 TaxID=3399129 RepID=UPI003A4E47BF